jgi:hypothetical protein
MELIRIDKPIRLHVMTWLLFATVWSIVTILTTRFSTDAAGRPNAFGDWLCSGGRKGIAWTVFGAAVPAMFCSVILSYRYAGAGGGPPIVGLIAGLLSLGPMLIGKHMLPGEVGACVRAASGSDLRNAVLVLIISTISCIFGYVARRNQTGN